MTDNEKQALKLRQKLQKDAIEAVVRDRYVIVNWGTGVGKSRVGIGAAKEMFSRGALNILLLVDQTFHKQNWLAEFRDTLGEEEGRFFYDSLTVECYASLPKYKGTEWDLVIADEAHHLRSDNRIAQMSTLKAERILCLSATVSCKGDGASLIEMLNTTFGIFRSLDFGLQDAIDTGILAEPTIHIHCLPLDGLSARYTITESWGNKDRQRRVQCRYEDRFAYADKKRFPAAVLEIDSSIPEAYDYYTRNFLAAKKNLKKLEDSADPQQDPAQYKQLLWAKNKVLRYGGLRKLVVGQAKTIFCRGLLKRIGDKKTLCFCTDVEQAIALGGGNVIFADRKDRLGDIRKAVGDDVALMATNQEVVDAFNKGDIRSLFAVNMIQEGQNLAGIEVGVTVQLAGKDRQFIQKFGRTLRSKDPQQHIVVVDGTKDVEYLKDSLAEINPKYFVFHGYGRLKGTITKLTDLMSDDELREKEAAEKEAEEKKKHEEAGRAAGINPSLFGHG